MNQRLYGLQRFSNVLDREVLVVRVLKLDALMDFGSDLEPGISLIQQLVEIGDPEAFVDLELDLMRPAVVILHLPCPSFETNLKGLLSFT